jgi:hypothetical protein
MKGNVVPAPKYHAMDTYKAGRGIVPNIRYLGTNELDWTAAHPGLFTPMKAVSEGPRDAQEV